MSQIVFHSHNRQMNNLLLDIAPGPNVAFSLRKLNSSYNGYAVKIRRNQDGVLADIGFDSLGNFDTSAFNAHLNGSSPASTHGYVTIWYDQSGNGNDASQSSSGNQPELILNASGSFNGVLFTGSSSQRLMLSSTVTLTTGVSNLNVVKKVSTTNILEMLGNTSSSNTYSEYWNNGGTSFSMGSPNPSAGYDIFPTSNINNTSLNLIGAFGDTSSGVPSYKQCYFNVAVATSYIGGSQPKSSYDCLGYSDANYCTGYIFEVLLWPGANGNETNIVNNIKAYYGV